MWCRACPSLQPLSRCEHLRVQRGCSTCRDPAVQAPLAPAQRWGGDTPTPPFLEEELGSVSSPEGSHPEALFAAASVQTGLACCPRAVSKPVQFTLGTPSDQLPFLEGVISKCSSSCVSPRTRFFEALDEMLVILLRCHRLKTTLHVNIVAFKHFQCELSCGKRLCTAVYELMCCEMSMITAEHCMDSLPLLRVPTGNIKALHWNTSESSCPRGALRNPWSK